MKWNSSSFSPKVTFTPVLSVHLVQSKAYIYSMFSEFKKKKLMLSIVGSTVLSLLYLVF